ncbi:MAG: hypothetical protein JJ979_24715 [Roseibium sp.]|nr:hypothetical protein [Roseibium sp.]
MNDDIFGGDTALTVSDEDHTVDTLDDTVDALANDEELLTDEHPGSDEGDAELDDEFSEDEQSDEGQSDDDAETEADQDLAGSDEVLVNLGDGEQVSLGELKKGFLRNKDYTHKTEALSQERTEVDTMRSNVQESRQLLQQAYQNLTDYLVGLVPPEPDLALAQTNPGDYQYQLALRNNAIAELRKVMDVQQQVDAGAQKSAEDDFKRYQTSEEAALVKAMPVLRDPGRRAAFDKANHKTATEFGFTEQEITSTADHRILQLVHYARIGKIAEANRRNAGRRVSEKATKGTARTVPAAGSRPSKQSKALRAYRKNGSLAAAEALVDADDI